MDELIDILDSTGKSTGKTALKSHAHRMGLFHATVHVWFYTKEGFILLQQRGANKATFPLLWDVSVAGHVGAGEAIELSAIREVEEEIGLQITPGESQKIGVFQSIQKHNSHLIDCEFHHTYQCELKVPLEHLVKQKEEVEALKLVPFSIFSEEILGERILEKYVPHSQEYYSRVLKAMEKNL